MNNLRLSVKRTTERSNCKGKRPSASRVKGGTLEADKWKKHRGDERNTWLLLSISYSSAFDYASPRYGGEINNS